MADTPTAPVVVIGLGRFGTALAVELDRRGTEVLAIDGNPAVVQKLAGRLPHVVTADSTDAEALHQLDITAFHRAVVAIGTDIQASILTTALLSDLGIRDIWAKAVNAQHAGILSRVGAHHVVFPENDMGERVAHLLSGRILDYVEVDADFAVIKTTPPRDVVGVPLRESRLRSRWGVTVVAVKPQAPAPGAPRGFTYATPDTVLAYGDIVLVVGAIDKVERFAETD
ncbi:potassium channel family protein [Catenuloplanes atrovinosus]|uniref:Trk system potassium uptake protein TrkA n=1 Tax=Catenuloplanes atrovinosus TaxID=137266 RepID=A0AAE3YQ32_9ACTN|nr:TrkA family potassium uptake protein [Catenuloplanes atrovinosus]MDR7277595.1 trk system potassium uptake protein TrkA [Catenuloplanes atrovinosus]